jgi:hypothetical protein
MSPTPGSEQEERDGCTRPRAVRCSWHAEAVACCGAVAEFAKTIDELARCIESVLTEGQTNAPPRREHGSAVPDLTLLAAGSPVRLSGCGSPRAAAGSPRAMSQGADAATPRSRAVGPGRDPAAPVPARSRARSLARRRRPAAPRRARPRALRAGGLTLSGSSPVSRPASAHRVRGCRGCATGRSRAICVRGPVPGGWCRGCR